MTQINLPFDIQPGQLEDVSQVMANIEAIVAVVNGGLGNDNLAPTSPLSVDKIQGGPPGSTLITGPGGTPSWQPAGGEAPGVIKAYGGDAAPAGYLLCDGAAVSVAAYQTLYDVIGRKYGAGDGVNTFGLPNFKGRVPLGSDSAIADFSALGKVGGAKDVPLTVAQLPSHNHGGGNHDHGGAVVPADNHYHDLEPWHALSGGTTGSPIFGELLEYSGQPGQLDVRVTNVTGWAGAHGHAIAAQAPVAAQGDGATHPNMPPFLTVNFIIKT